MRSILKPFLFLLVAAPLLTACNAEETGVPLVAVDVEINITLPSYSSLSVVGGWAYVAGGSKGLLVYRRSTQEFVAYDRHVPYNVDEGCVAAVTSNNVECEDPCSESKFSIYDGTVTNGPAALPLKQYSTSFDGTVVRIYN